MELKFKPGQRVRITSGDHAGRIGTVGEIVPVFFPDTPDATQEDCGTLIFCAFDVRLVDGEVVTEREGNGI